MFCNKMLILFCDRPRLGGHMIVMCANAGVTCANATVRYRYGIPVLVLVSAGTVLVPVLVVPGTGMLHQY